MTTSVFGWKEANKEIGKEIKKWKRKTLTVELLAIPSNSHLSLSQQFDLRHENLADWISHLIFSPIIFLLLCIGTRHLHLHIWWWNLFILLCPLFSLFWLMTAPLFSFLNWSTLSFMRSFPRSKRDYFYLLRKLFSFDIPPRNVWCEMNKAFLLPWSYMKMII